MSKIFGAQTYAKILSHYVTVSMNHVDLETHTWFMEYKEYFSTICTIVMKVVEFEFESSEILLWFNAGVAEGVK